MDEQKCSYIICVKIVDSKIVTSSVPLPSFIGGYDSIYSAILAEEDGDVHFMKTEFVETAFGSALFYFNEYITVDSMQDNVLTAPLILFEHKGGNSCFGVHERAWLVPHNDDFSPMKMTQDECKEYMKNMRDSFARIYMKNEEDVEVLPSQRVSERVPKKFLEIARPYSDEMTSSSIFFINNVLSCLPLLKRTCVKVTSLLPVFFQPAPNVESPVIYNTVRQVLNPRKANAKINPEELKKLYFINLFIGDAIKNGFTRLVSQYTGIPLEINSFPLVDCENLYEALRAKLLCDDDENSKRLGRLLLGNLFSVNSFLVMQENCRDLSIALESIRLSGDFADNGVTNTWHDFEKEWFDVDIEDINAFREVVCMKLLGEDLDNYNVIKNFSEALATEIDAFNTFEENSEGVFLVDDKVLCNVMK